MNYLKTFENHVVKDINWFIGDKNISLDDTELNCFNNKLPYSNDDLETIKREIKR